MLGTARDDRQLTTPQLLVHAVISIMSSEAEWGVEWLMEMFDTMTVLLRGLGSRLHQGIFLIPLKRARLGLEGLLGNVVGIQI